MKISLEDLEDLLEENTGGGRRFHLNFEETCITVPISTPALSTITLMQRPMHIKATPQKKAR